MANEKRLIDANKAQKVLVNMAEHLLEAGNPEMGGAVGYAAEVIGKQKKIDAIPVVEIKAYLQARLDEWNALGDRKWEPANMWGYNFIMACFDDLDRRGEECDR